MEPIKSSLTLYWMCLRSVLPPTTCNESLKLPEESSESRTNDKLFQALWENSTNLKIIMSLLEVYLC